MTRHDAGLCSFAIVIVLMGGCASLPKDAGFGDVERTIAERTGKRVHWSQGGPEDRAAGQALHAILAQPLTADGAVQIALLNNRELQATYEDLGIAQAALVQAGLFRNPVLTAGALRQ